MPGDLARGGDSLMDSELVDQLVEILIVCDVVPSLNIVPVVGEIPTTVGAAFFT